MKKIKYIILLLVSTLIYQTSVYSQESLKIEVVNFMDEYEKYSSFTIDGLSYEKAYEISFRDLFLPERLNDPILKDHQVFNDLEEGSKPAYIAKEEYVRLAREKFPKGINIEIYIEDIKEQKKLDSHKPVEVKVKKKLFGLNKSGKIYQKEYDLIYLIKYNIVNNEPSKLKIVSISAKGIPRKPTGLYVGVNLQPSLTKIGTDGFLNENSSYGNWSQEGKFKFNGGIEINYYLKDPSMGFGARINYSSYQAEFQLDSYTQNPVELVDIDNDSYHLLASGESLNESVSLSYIEIPIFFKYRFVLYKSNFLNHAYINLGPVFSFNISSSVNSDGKYTYEGYYPDYHVSLFDIPEYNFYTDKDFVSTPNSNLKTISLAGFAEVGINIPLLSDKLNMNIAILYQQGFMNLSEGNNDFILTSGYNNYNALVDSRSNVKTGLLGVNVGILYKIF